MPSPSRAAALRGEVVAAQRHGAAAHQRRVEDLRPAGRLLLVVAGDQPMLRQRFQIGRQAIVGDVGGAGAHHPALGGDAAGVQRAVLLFADADGGVEPFLRRIGQTFGQIEVDRQLWVAFRQRRQQRQHIGFAEGRQAADAQRALRRFVQRLARREGR